MHALGRPGKKRRPPPIWRVSDELWAIIAPILEECDPAPRMGRKRVDQRGVLDAVTGLGKALGLEITAEGTERAEHLDRVKSVGCHRGQGFQFGEPLPAAGMVALIGPPPSPRDELDGRGQH